MTNEDNGQQSNGSSPSTLTYRREGRKKKEEVSLIVNGHKMTIGMVSPSYNIGYVKGTKLNVPIYDQRTQKYIAEKAKERVLHGFDCPIIISGPRRTGKTTNAIGIARHIDRNFPVENISFRLTDFRATLERLPYADPSKGVYPVAILDESGIDLYSKDWMTLMVREMTKVFQIIGKKCLTMILVLPHRNFLSRDIRESMYLWIATRTIDNQRGFAELREGCDNIWNLDLFWKPLCGFIFDELDDDFWKAYEERKVSFINEYVATTSTPRYSTQRDALVRLAYETKSYEEIHKATGLSLSTISAIINKTGRTT